MSSNTLPPEKLKEIRVLAGLTDQELESILISAIEADRDDLGALPASKEELQRMAELAKEQAKKSLLQVREQFEARTKDLHAKDVEELVEHVAIACALIPGVSEKLHSLIVLVILLKHAGTGIFKTH